jgi:hypothetical protein
MDRVRACGHCEEPAPVDAEDEPENVVQQALSNQTQLIVVDNLNPAASYSPVASYSHQFPTVSGHSLDSPSQDQQSADAHAPHRCTEPARCTEHADPTVQDYMNQLFDRLRGQTAQAPQPVVNRPAQVKKLPESEVATEVKPLVKVLDPSEYVPKRVAPERNANIDAMRALANDSIRSALHISNQQRRRAMGLFQIGSAIGGAVLGAGLFALSGEIGDWYFYGGSLSMIVGGISAYRFFITNFFGSKPRPA